MLTSLFVADIESTGASSEFYDKFTIRFHLSIIFKSLWDIPIQQMQIINQATCARRSSLTVSNLQMIALAGFRGGGQRWVKFVNMLMNDTTFLLDESLQSLKTIRELQDLIENKSEFEKLPQQQQQAKTTQLEQEERQCRTYLTLANETVDMFYYLSAKICEPFLTPVRIAVTSCYIIMLCPIFHIIQTSLSLTAGARRSLGINAELQLAAALWTKVQRS